MSDRPLPPPHIEIDETLPPGVRPTSYCPPIALVRAYQEHVLPSTLASEIDEHLQHCGLCSMLLADLEHVPQPALTPQERDRIRRAVPSPLNVPGWRWYTSFAAAAALIVAAIFSILHRSAPAPNQAINIAQPQQTKPNPPQLPRFEVAKLDPPFELVPGLVLRGASPSDQPTPAQLASAFDAYTQSEYPLADQRFSQLTKEFPHADIPFLYLGVSQLLQNDSAAALPNLTQAEHLAEGPRKDAAAWYHALAAAHAGAPEAPALLHTLCHAKKSAYATQACELEKSQSAVWR